MATPGQGGKAPPDPGVATCLPTVWWTDGGWDEAGPWAHEPRPGAMVRAKQRAIGAQAMQQAGRSEDHVGDTTGEVEEAGAPVAPELVRAAESARHVARQIRAAAKGLGETAGGLAYAVAHVNAAALDMYADELEKRHG